jgi:exodeoxyribonuclease V gamma subunit
MAGLNLYTSNRLEVLSRRLAGIIAEPLPSPFDKEIVIIQSTGMERWISMQLARTWGICANASFPFPNAFVADMFSRVLGSQTGDPEGFFRPATMTWRLMALLPSLLDDPAFVRLKTYLGEQNDDLKLYQLCTQIARVYDQYLAYRPEMIVSWETSADNGPQADDDSWQILLWHALVTDTKARHAATLREKFLSAIQRNDESLSTLLPSRISVFGIPSLPDFHLGILAALSRHLDVHIFFMNPSEKFWDYIVSDKERMRRIRKVDKPDIDEELLHLESGNPLLGSLGKSGRGFLLRLHELVDDENADYHDPGTGSLLACLQHDILMLHDRGKDDTARKKIGDDDRSLQLHSCHSAMREIEVLHNNLLSCFERFPGLEPRDIIVMTPDIELYAPFIQAIFDNPQSDSVRIPYSIADRHLHAVSDYAQAFLALIELADSRFEAPAVVGCLELPAVARRFALDAGDLDRIKQWVAETGIRWAINKEHRETLELGSFVENTWQAGTNRMLLGYALPQQDPDLFAEILPYDQVEGSNAAILGKFVDFINRLISFATILTTPHTLDEWHKILMDVAESLLLADTATEPDALAVRKRLAEIETLARRSGNRQAISLRVIRHYLRQTLDADFLAQRGFISGGVTFCSLLPMRSIPSRIIYLLGINDSAYPRNTRAPGFDLIAAHPQSGDRTSRGDDRYLFLEAILSARDELHISYVGQSLRDNASMPPSVVVSELLDYCNQAFIVPENAPGPPRTAADRLLVRHQLQAFHPAYFAGSGGRLFSYSADDHAASRLIDDHVPVPALCPMQLPDPPQERKKIDLIHFQRFFSNPSKHFMHRRLECALGEDEEPLQETEPFSLDPLDRYDLGQQILNARLAGRDPAPFFSYAHAKGILPHGNAGRSHFDSLVAEVESMVRVMRRAGVVPAQHSLPFTLDLGEFALAGELGGVSLDGHVACRFATLKPHDHLRAWISHLILSTVRSAGRDMKVVLAGRNAVVEFTPIDNPESMLAHLLSLYWRGLSAPLRFFPAASQEFAAATLNPGRSKKTPLERAREVWNGSSFTKVDPESKDPYYQLCFRDRSALDGEFGQVAMEVWKPILEHEKEIGGIR